MKGYFQVTETPVIVGRPCPRTWPSSERLSCRLHFNCILTVVLRHCYLFLLQAYHLFLCGHGVALRCANVHQEYIKRYHYEHSPIAGVDSFLLLRTY